MSMEYKMNKYINADGLRALMYHKAFEEETELQKWDSGCWIRYKLFEQALGEMPSADVVEIKHGHWELDGTCSVCRKHTLQSHGNFCCYCGADMRKENRL